jgi:putative endonuclease
MTGKTQAIGQWGEETAARYLESKGYTILRRNFHTAHGEIDIVAEKEAGLIFVEVKTRSSHAFAYPEESVNRRKQSESWQFDVIAIERKTGGKPEIVHFENVIE